jgi:hypothetical protein
MENGDITRSALGERERAFDASTPDENLVENWDNTHLIVHMCIGRTLSAIGGNWEYALQKEHAPYSDRRSIPSGE